MTFESCKKAGMIACRNAAQIHMISAGSAQSLLFRAWMPQLSAEDIILILCGKRQPAGLNRHIPPAMLIPG